jgi:Xaa-Pro aminopeptidase
VHDAALKVLVEGLIALKFISGPLEEALKDKTKYGPFFPHGTSHWLGLDVHDAGAYHDGANSSIPLVAGNILTVEPGIYIPTDRADIPAEYRGIGIRIEDDVLVTAEGYEVLTLGAPKEIAELEAIVGTGTRKP